MQSPLITKDEITSYIPQGHPIVMVDNLLFCDDTKTVSSFVIEPDNIFVKNGNFTEPGIIENIAQTVALKAGYESKKEDTEPLVGFIGAIKKLKIYHLPELYSEIQTEIKITHRVFNIIMFEARSFCRQVLVAECEMKIAIQKTDPVAAI